MTEKILVEDKQSEKPYVPDFLDCCFEDTLLYQPYFTYVWNGGYYKVHASILDTIRSWAAVCTEPNEGIHYFNNPSAMFAALDMIYKLIDEAQDGFIDFENEVRGETRQYIVQPIENLSSLTTITKEEA